MEEQGVKVYPYRWVVLALFMLINVMVQVLWIGYAPIATLAAAAYGVKREDIDLLANLFMLIYLVVSFPAAWAIDTYGFKKAVGFGALMMGAFGLLRAFFPTNYTMALVGTIGISVGQPFLLNAFTKFAAIWFPQKHRATITGVIFLAMFLGIALGEVLGPGLVSAYGFTGLQHIYGIASAVSALLFLALARSEPPTPASPAGEEVRALVLDSLKQILKNKSVYILSLALFLASGIVNGVFTLIDGLGKRAFAHGGSGRDADGPVARRRDCRQHRDSRGFGRLRTPETRADHRGFLAVPATLGLVGQRPPLGGHLLLGHGLCRHACDPGGLSIWR